jgi:hypothetical protein
MLQNCKVTNIFFDDVVGKEYPRRNIIRDLWQYEEEYMA